MTRKPDKQEHEREVLEGCNGCLGNALVLIGLSLERLASAIQYGQQGSILTPAVNDLQNAQQLIRRAQCLAAGDTHNAAA